jgi:LysR family transcriptional regulator (chromosome initiation inhibitor)
LPQGSRRTTSETFFIAFNRKDDLQAEFVAQAFHLRRVSLNQLFVPSSEGRCGRCWLAGA